MSPNKTVRKFSRSLISNFSLKPSSYSQLPKSTVLNHPTPDFPGKEKSPETSTKISETKKEGGAQDIEYTRLQANQKQKEKEETEAWVRRFDAAQPDGRSLSVRDLEWYELRERFREDVERRERFLREHPEAAKPVERKRKRDFVKRVLLK